MTTSRSLDGSAPRQVDAVLIGVLIDNAREAVMRALRLGVDPGTILVSPAALSALYAAKQAENERGVKLTLLGRTVRADAALQPEEASVAL